MKAPHPFLFQISGLLIVVFFLPCNSFAQWSAPLNISPAAVSAGLNESMGSCLGVSNNTVHVVWTDKLSTTTAAIYYTRSADTGLSWSTPVALTPLGGNAWNPAIAVNGLNIHLVWRNIVNNIRSSYYKRSLDGGNTWGPDVLLDSAVADWPAVAVSGNNVYVANDVLVSSTPYNTEVFFLRSTDNGNTWSPPQQITFASGRSEDEAIMAQGPHLFMSWNDNRNGTMQIFCKHSADYGVTWGADILINSEPSYGTMVSINGNYIDIPSTGAASGHYQVHLNQSADTGQNWGPDKNLTNDPANTYYYPFMVRDGADLHMTYVKSGVGGQYLHSGDGGATWDAPVSTGFSGITPFIAYTGPVLHIIMPDSGHINYIRNPTGNGTEIDGSVTYDNAASSPMVGITVQLVKNGTVIKTTATDASGHYSFTHVGYGTYEVQCSTVKPWGGVNATDALLALEHFTHIITLTGLKLLAADVDASQVINSIDALKIVKRFVGQLNSFSIPDWLFEEASVTVDSHEPRVINIKALCAGDVNGSYTLPQ